MHQIDTARNLKLSAIQVSSHVYFRTTKHTIQHTSNSVLPRSTMGWNKMFLIPYNSHLQNPKGKIIGCQWRPYLQVCLNFNKLEFSFKIDLNSYRDGKKTSERENCTFVLWRHLGLQQPLFRSIFYFFFVVIIEFSFFIGVLLLRTLL